MRNNLEGPLTAGGDNTRPSFSRKGLSFLSVVFSTLDRSYETDATGGRGYILVNMGGYYNFTPGLSLLLSGDRSVVGE